MKKVKVFIAMIAVALGGLIIWSCTQDEMENGQVTYRIQQKKSPRFVPWRKSMECRKLSSLQKVQISF